MWTDWLALRKAKDAPVSDTVLSGAIGEAAKAGMTLEAFLRVWCLRGTQGMQADWLKPHERPATPATRPATVGKHAGFESKDYNAGVTSDGFIA